MFYVSANIAERFSLKKDSIRLPKVAVDNYEVDLGTLRKETSKRAFFKITNQGIDTLFIRRLSSPCSCIKLSNEDNRDYLLPNERMQVEKY